jgi:hypothetical protein
MFSDQSEATMEEETAGLRKLFPNADDRFFTQLYELYPRSEFQSTFMQRQTLFGDFIINCPSQWISDAVELYGKPVYKMIFNAGGGLHGATKPFLFDTAFGCKLPASRFFFVLLTGLPLLVTPKDNGTISTYLKDSYISFAIHQDPNTYSVERGAAGGQNVMWPRYSLADPKKVLEINASSIAVITDPDVNKRCNFWHAQSNVTRN